MSLSGKPSVCLLDAEGTLFELAPPLISQLHTAAATMSPVTEADIALAHDVIVKTGLWPGDQPDPETRLRSWASFCAAVISDACGGADTDALGLAVARRVASVSGYALFEDTIPALDALTSAGVRLCVVSNFDALLPEILHHLGVMERFEYVVTSFDVGIRKPDRAIFTMALRRMGVPASSAVFVGDSPFSDISGARAAGIDAVLVDRSGRHRETESRRVSRLSELLPLVGWTAPEGSDAR